MKRRQFLSSLDGLAALTQTCASRHHLNQRGLTLLELLVVLVILIATALIIFPTFNNIDITSPSGESNSPVEIATQATLNTVREAMAGEDGVIESLSHKTNALPREINDLLKEDAPAHMEESAPELKNYDPVNKIGWHGPYVRATGRNETGEPTIVDGWGNELELQVDFDQDGIINQTESKFIRVVSAGPNGQIETPDDITNMKPGENEVNELTLSECGDDLVMFLRYPDNRK
jgi:prepilin-type N-terminal cleavage/methylation domain-containing protein|tara:strand:- start:783 stop:1481 length:699 start_codon:yes stop_codon:yes gene_type:complete